MPEPAPDKWIVSILDANILFSAAYRDEASLQQLWRLEEVRLMTTRYAYEEAQRNLSADIQLRWLDQLMGDVEVVAPAPPAYARPQGVDLPEKNWPILLAALVHEATHLLTGDIRHFGRYFGARIDGMLVMRPAAYRHRHRHT